MPDNAEPQMDELRRRFVANRDKVRSWPRDWGCAEIAWPEVTALPSSHWTEPVPPVWLEQRAPYLHRYYWLLQAEPRAEGIAYVRGNWWFGPGHRFEHLAIETRTVADPQYLAEILALGAAAAALKGWQPDDVHPLYDWLLEGIGTMPVGNRISGNHRMGFIRFDLVRWGLSQTEIIVHLRIRLTDTDFEGRPLNEEGRPLLTGGG